jgi:arylsulfatase A-like enzyme
MSWNRRDVLKAIGAATTTAALTGELHEAEAEAATATQRRRPNILVFLTDDHGQWLQEAYGNSEVHTPNMSRIARSGVRMNNAFTTTPVCSPARASFFTGRMPSQHGIHDWIEEKTQAYAAPWLKGQTLISELLRGAGYHTALVGKWHCGFEREPRPGFDFWFSYWESQYPHTGRQRFSDNGKLVEPEGFQSPLLTDQALGFLRKHYAGAATKTKPFFLFVGYTDTHTPHKDMPDDLLERYRGASFRDVPHEDFSPAHGKPLIPATSDRTEERRKLEQYYAAASSIDREVGRVLDELAARGVLDDTLVVYTGDHGLNAGHHGMWEKGNATLPQNFLEESIRVPCAVSWPNGRVARGLASDACVNHCDLFATLLEAADAAPSGAAKKAINSPGRSYLEELRGLAKHEDTVFCEYGNARMLRVDGYKLIVRSPFRGVSFANEFYDLKADPRETGNVYDNAAHAERIERMTARLKEYFAVYSVPEHDGLRLEEQPMATPASPWLAAMKS